MYDRRFFSSSLGRAALASVTAMSIFVILSPQIAVSAPASQLAMVRTAELA